MSTPQPQKNDPHSTTIAVAGGGGPPYDESMEQRIEKLEVAIVAMKLDLEIIKATGATKSDLAEHALATKADIAELRNTTKADIAELRSATKADIAELRNETKAEIVKLQAELKAMIAEAKTSVIMWVTSAIFLAQLLPALLQHFSK
jgi:ribosomal protein L29